MSVPKELLNIESRTLSTGVLEVSVTLELCGRVESFEDSDNLHESASLDDIPPVLEDEVVPSYEDSDGVLVVAASVSARYVQRSARIEPAVTLDDDVIAYVDPAIAAKTLHRGGQVSVGRIALAHPPEGSVSHELWISMPGVDVFFSCSVSGAC